MGLIPTECWFFSSLSISVVYPYSGPSRRCNTSDSSLTKNRCLAVQLGAQVAGFEKIWQKIAGIRGVMEPAISIKPVPRALAEPEPNP